MQLETLSCNNCGAPIEVPESANYVTCAHCGSRLMVHRDETAHYTEVMEQLSGLTTRADQTDEQLRRLQIDNELLRLDQNWEASKGDYMLNTKSGPVEPTLWRAWAGAIFLVIAVLVACGLILPSTGASKDSSSGFIFLMLLVTCPFALWGVVDGFMKYNAYQEAQQNYYQMRETIENRRRQPPLGKLTD